MNRRHVIVLVIAGLTFILVGMIIWVGGMYLDARVSHSTSPPATAGTGSQSPAQQPTVAPEQHPLQPEINRAEKLLLFLEESPEAKTPKVLKERLELEKKINELKRKVIETEINKP